MKSKAKKQYRAWKSKGSPKGKEEKEQGQELTEEGKELQTPNWSSRRRRSLKKTRYRWKMKAMPPRKLIEAMWLWRGMDAAPAGRRARWMEQTRKGRNDGHTRETEEPAQETKLGQRKAPHANQRENHVRSSKLHQNLPRASIVRSKQSKATHGGRELADIALRPPEATLWLSDISLLIMEMKMQAYALFALWIGAKGVQAAPSINHV